MKLTASECIPHYDVRPLVAPQYNVTHKITGDVLVPAQPQASRPAKRRHQEHILITGMLALSWRIQGPFQQAWRSTDDRDGGGVGGVRLLCAENYL